MPGSAPFPAPRSMQPRASACDLANVPAGLSCRLALPVAVRACERPRRRRSPAPPWPRSWVPGGLGDLIVRGMQTGDTVALVVRGRNGRAPSVGGRSGPGSRGGADRGASNDLSRGATRWRSRGCCRAFGCALDRSQKRSCRLQELHRVVRDRRNLLASARAMPVCRSTGVSISARRRSPWPRCSRGDIDLYPEYTGTAAIDVLHLPPMHDSQTSIARWRAVRGTLRLLLATPSPMNDSQGLAITEISAKRERIETLSQLRRSHRGFAWRRFKSFSCARTAYPDCRKCTADFVPRSPYVRYHAEVSGSARGQSRRRERLYDRRRDRRRSSDGVARRSQAVAAV